MSYSRGGRRRFGRRSSSKKNTTGREGRLKRYTNSAQAVVAELPEVKIEHQFTDFALDDRLQKNIAQRGYEEPTPIQDQAIPELLAGKDVVGIANTGTGKTAAFLLPFIDKVLQDSDQGVLILAPTRELALQIRDEFVEFAKDLPIGVSVCIGGTSMDRQIKQLAQNPHFVIATPGRLIDLLKRRHFDPEMFTNIVLDEVDRMLDIGFRQDILFLISKLPRKRHAAFFSATSDSATDEIMRKLMDKPVKISVKQAETSHHVEQKALPVKIGQDKVEMLHDILIQGDVEKAIIFGRTKHGINKLERKLKERGFKVIAIHGNKSQGARQRACVRLKDGHVQALLATDVAARGIDIDDVSHVINYDEPQSYADYVHRIGRTGRAGKVGTAITFVE
ncbi:DEAD/DEAH box helicase [Candidatus Woesebacteria bacterium]|nr:DEAD/DEAH box helicase [Candidatus Woesebacteria bacterium]